MLVERDFWRVFGHDAVQQRVGGVNFGGLYLLVGDGGGFLEDLGVTSLQWGNVYCVLKYVQSSNPKKVPKW